MNRVLEDFVNAGRGRRCGIFEGDQLAAEKSRELTRNERKRMLRGGRITVKVYEYLKESGMIREAPKGSITEGDLLDLLWANIGNKETGNDTAEYVYKIMVKEKYPSRSRSFDTAQRIWKRVENSKVKKKGGRPSN